MLTWPIFLECSSYFLLMHQTVLYNVGKFHSPSPKTFWDMNYYPVWFFNKSIRQLEKFFSECSEYFSRMHLIVFYNVVKFQHPNCNTFRDMNYCPVWIIVQSEFWSSPDRQTDRQKVTHMSPPCKVHRWAQQNMTMEQYIIWWSHFFNEFSVFFWRGLGVGVYEKWSLISFCWRRWTFETVPK